jgi:putative DNA primase/helicase
MDAPRTDDKAFSQRADINGIETVQDAIETQEREKIIACAPSRPPRAISLHEIPEATDLGRAHRFIERFGDSVRYVPEWDRWLVFEEGRWNMDSGRAAAHRLAAEICRESYEYALTLSDNSQRQAGLRNAAAWADYYVVKNMLLSARNDQRVIVRPSELDANPWLVGARNGFVDLKTGERFEHSCEHLVTKFVGADFDPNATCPRWEKFMEEILPDEAVRDFVQKAAGYSLSGHTTEHFFMFLHGRGANGKSTFLEILFLAFGDYAGRAGSRLIYATDRYGTPDDQIAELFGRRLVIASETLEGVRLQEGVLKDITGADTLRGCRKYEHGFSFKSTAKLWLAGNHKPTIRGTDDGIWRRVSLIPFEKQFGPGERDEHLRAKLLGELPGILNWLIQGAILWQKEGLTPPEIVRAAVADYRSEEDTLSDFLEECTREDEKSKTPHSDIFKAYRQWTEEMGVFPVSSKILAKRLRERGWSDMRTAGSKCVWRGIALQE